MDGGRVGDYFISDCNVGVSITVLDSHYTYGERASNYEAKAMLNDLACLFFVAAAQTGGCCLHLTFTSSGSKATNSTVGEEKDPCSLLIMVARRGSCEHPGRYGQAGCCGKGNCETKCRLLL